MRQPGALSPPRPPVATVYPGSGPRHFVFDPSGKVGYQLSEMSGVVDVFAWDTTKGSLTSVQSAHTVPHDFVGRNHSAEIEISPDGKFLYESNRRTKSETERAPRYPRSIFHRSQGRDPGNPALQQSLTGGVMPRSFTIDPTGSYLLVANQLSNNVVVFRIDRATGRLSTTGKEVKVDTPVCLQFGPGAP